MAFKTRAVEPYDWKITAAKFGKGLAIAVLVYILAYLTNSPLQDPFILAAIPILTAIINLLKAKWGIDIFGLS
jgi:hypothetical protein